MPAYSTLTLHKLFVTMTLVMNAKEFNKHLKSADSNRLAFVKLYEEFYSKIVLHIALKFNHSIAQDIAHDFFCKIVEGKFKETNTIEYPTAWIYKICDNLAINTYKKDAKYVSLADFEFADHAQNIDNLLDVTSLFENLDMFERKVIYLHFFEGYSLKEIAASLNIKYDNFRKKYGSILKKIRKYNNLFPK